MKQDRISIIVAIYKVEDYIERCIKSIVQQTYKNLEIILVDDGSPDRCPEICDWWEMQDERIRVIHKKNGGLSDARNAGMKIATGKYIAFVDGDDWLEPEMYEKLYLLCKEKKCQIAVCNFCVNEGTENNKTQLGARIVYTGKEFLEKIMQKECTQITYSVWKCLYDRELVKGLAFVKGRYYEDVPFSTEVYLKVDKVAYLEEALYHYMIRDTSITQISATNKHMEDMLVILEIQKELIQRYYEDMPVWVKEHIYWMCSELKLRALSLEQKQIWLRKINQMIYEIGISAKQLRERTLKNYVKYFLSRYMIRAYSFVLKRVGGKK